MDDNNTFMTRTMRSRSDYGLKIAKKGFDVYYANDNQLLYNSSFPVLQIVGYIDPSTQWEVVETGSYQWWNPYNGSVSTRWRHNLRKMHGVNHPPMIVPLNPDYFGGSGKQIEWNSKYVYSFNEFYSQAEYNAFIANVDTGKFIIFDVDIETDVEYPYVDDGIDTEWGQTYDYGIKHMLTDDTETTDPNKLGLNANIQSLMVVAVKVATSDNPNENKYEPLGISTDRLSPFCFIKSRSTDRWRPGGVSIQATRGFRPAIGWGYYRLDGQLFDAKCSLVLTRLPMISPDKQNFSMNM